MAESAQLPFQPIRGELYSSEELMRGYDPDNPLSMASIPDFKTFVYFVKNGRATPRDPYAGMMEALHDNSILQSMFRFIETCDCPTAAIMGGHKEERGSSSYKSVTLLSKRLTENGFLMASGGGPGAMEATHLGAILSGKGDDEVDKALTSLQQEKALPNSKNIVDESGNVDGSMVEEIHKWAKPAFELFKDIKQPGLSLAVPTWHYGHEPLTPLATHVAKYFQNSIREDVLLALAGNGIIFAPGRAGTLQEVFQDAAQNYYHGANEPFSPMVFFDTAFWRNELPIEPLLEALFTNNGKGEEYEKKVRFMDDIDEIVDFLVEQKNQSKEGTSRFEAMGMGLNF
ncbi:MAG: hypothetical protein KC652_05490 [Cyanobacteria bacterium HKST-UBA01]|nr:hypothetical protein [Cyanobacteria bacterium HKST-UBA01]